MIQGLSEDQKKILEQVIITPLKSKKCRVWVFGSRANGRFKKFSDIDLLFESPQNQGLPLGFISGLQEQIEDSKLIYKVDLVDVKELAESYKERVLKQRVEL